MQECDTVHIDDTAGMIGAMSIPVALRGLQIPFAVASFRLLIDSARARDDH